MVQEKWRDAVGYYVWFVPRRVFWAAEDALRWMICRVRGHRWTASFPAMPGGGGLFAAANIPFDCTLTHCGRCGKRINRALTFSTRTVDPYRIW